MRCTAPDWPPGTDGWTVTVTDDGGTPQASAAAAAAGPLPAPAAAATALPWPVAVTSPGWPASACCWRSRRTTCGALAPVGGRAAGRGGAPPPGAGPGSGWACWPGWCCFVPLLSWTNLHIGSLPWLLLSVPAGRLPRRCWAAAAAYAQPAGGPVAVDVAAADRRCCGWRRRRCATGPRSAASRGAGWRSARATRRCWRLAALGGAPLVTFAVGAGRRAAGAAALAA